MPHFCLISDKFTETKTIIKANIWMFACLTTAPILRFIINIYISHTFIAFLLFPGGGESQTHLTQVRGGGGSALILLFIQAC